MYAATSALNDLSLAPELLGLNVLLVQDNPIELEAIAAHLLDAGFEVTTARSICSAIDNAQLTLPDVVVSGMLIDGLDGFALCEMMRCIPTLEDTPYLLTTSRVYGEDRLMADLMGDVAVVQQSPGFEAEWAALRTLLGWRAPSAESRKLPASDLRA